MNQSPPRVPRAVLRTLLGEREGEIEVSLGELFAVRVEREGLGRARRWYWRQVMGFGLEFLGDRRGISQNRVGTMWMWMREMAQAGKSLLRSPGFTALAVGALALGIGANTAIFSVIYGSLLRPLPYSQPDRVVWLSSGHSEFGRVGGANQSVPNFLDVQAESQLMSASAIYKIRSGNLSTTQQPQRVTVLYASADFLGVLGVAPQVGRDLRAGDDVYGIETAVLLTDQMWRARFGGEPSIIGQTTILDARAVRIVGILPKDFSFPGDPQLLMALQHQGAGLIRGNRGHNSIGRLTEGVSLDALRAELRTISNRLEEAYPEANDGSYTWAEPFADFAIGRNRQSLFLLGGAALLVLLIACGNVTNLMLVRAETRRREFALRYALGATWTRMLAHFLGEGLILAFVGAGLGTALAHWGVGALVAAYGEALPRANESRTLPCSPNGSNRWGWGWSHTPPAQQPSELGSAPSGGVSGFIQTP